VANAQRIWQGHADFELSERGLLEARAVAGALCSASAGHLWSSPLKRAAGTADSIAAAVGIQVVHDERWMESDVGEASGLTHDQVLERFPERALAMAEGRRFTFPGQEDPVAFRTRIHGALQAMLALDATMIAVTHGGVIGSIAAEVLGMAPERAWPFSIQNCSITEVVSDERGRLALRRLNDTCHLDGIAHRE
jgi:probable phosphoglycerate mutase